MGVWSTFVAALDQVQVAGSAAFDVDAHVSVSCPRCVQWGKDLGSLLTMAFDRCLSTDYSCTMNMGIVVLKNKASIHTPNKRNDIGCQYVVPVVQPRDPSLHNMERGCQ